MKENIFYACIKTGLKVDALNCALDVYEKADTELTDYFENALTQYKKREFNFKAARAELEQHSNRTCISDRQLALVLLLILTPELEKRYRELGLPQEMFDGIIQDIRYKAEECRKVYGEYGVFVIQWYIGIFEPVIFSFGRLQFELRPLDIPICGFKEGDMRIAVHIPSSGPLDIAECKKSIERASVFFNDKRSNDGRLLFTCNSWLLYEKNPEIITFDSNILRFKDMFEILSTNQSNNDIWRIFGVTDATDFNTLPETTRLMRDFKRYILENGSIGSSLGYIIK